MLFITTYATKGYCYAMPEQRDAIVRALAYARIPASEVGFVMAGDGSDTSKGEFDRHCAAMPFAVAKYVKIERAEVSKVKHTDEGCLLIAEMQEKAWGLALQHGATQVWSLESDIIPSPKTLQAMRDTLAFDHGWYGTAMCTYPNYGFLGGEANDTEWICPSVYPEERELADSVKERMRVKKARMKELDNAKAQPTPEDIAEWKALDVDVENSPASGNVWELNHKFGYKPRGWFDFRYPAIGLGAVLPTQWTGLGCTLLSQRAAELANFSGYSGMGTQDLWLGRRCWIPNGIRLAVISHAVCDHVKYRDGKYIRFCAHHATEQASFGHLRVTELDFVPRVHEQSPIKKGK